MGSGTHIHRSPLVMVGNSGTYQPHHEERPLPQLDGQQDSYQLVCGDQTRFLQGAKPNRRIDLDTETRLAGERRRGTGGGALTGQEGVAQHTRQPPFDATAMKCAARPPARMRVSRTRKDRSLAPLGLAVDSFLRTVRSSVWCRFALAYTRTQTQQRAQRGLMGFARTVPPSHASYAAASPHRPRPPAAATWRCPQPPLAV